MKKFVYTVMLVGIAIAPPIAMVAGGCGSPDQIGSGGVTGGGTPGTVVVKLDGSAGIIGGGGSNGGGGGPPPTGDANCGSVVSNTSHLPADVLLVLDRSGSMVESMSENCYCDPALATSSIKACADTTNCTTRWAAVSSGLKSTLSSTSDIRWGLKFFSSPNSSNACTVNNGVEVQIAANSASAIQTQIDGAKPANNTPTAQAVTAATAYLKTVNDPNNKVILLATDGEPNCASTDRNGQGTPNVPATVDAIGAAKTAGFPTYVIGIGPSTGNLDNFASAGGTDKYYPATSSADLASALAAISTRVTTCTFTSATPPPDPNNVAVYLDKNLVDKDPVNGWSFGPNNQTIVLNGSSCAKVTNGDATNVQILFGCGGPPPQNIP